MYKSYLSRLYDIDALNTGEYNYVTDCAESERHIV